MVTNPTIDITMPTPLSALASIISSSVQSLESTYSKHGLQFPSLDDPYKPGSLDEDAVVLEASRLIVAAASQIIAAVRSPEDTVREIVPSMYISSSLGFVVDTNVPDILQDAGPQVYPPHLFSHAQFTEVTI